MLGGMAEHAPIPVETNVIARRIYECAFRVHSNLGPGLLESVYAGCLAHEIAKSGLAFRREVGLPVVYEDVRFEAGYRLDFLVEECVIVEIKAVEGLHPVHVAQLLTYLKLSERRVGLLINFNVPVLKEGVKRLVR